MADIIQLRRDTAANWTSADPTLAAGELGYESDTVKFKIGDGTTAWVSLGYSLGTSIVNIVDLTDVLSSMSPNDNDLLTFDTASGKWEAQAAGASSSPLTTKGDVYGYSTVNARIPVGTNGQVLEAASTQALGLKWATPASGVTDHT